MCEALFRYLGKRQILSSLNFSLYEETEIQTDEASTPSVHILCLEHSMCSVNAECIKQIQGLSGFGCSHNSDCILHSKKKGMRQR